MTERPVVSVVLASYNQPNCLRLVLEGFRRQDARSFELIVADDGSAPDTRELVDAFSRRAGFALRFASQPHEGFRKARALNGAVLAARGDLLVFCDGDCVPFRSFVGEHQRAHRPRGYAVGGYVRLSEAESRTLTAEAVARGAHEAMLSPARRASLCAVHRRNRVDRLLRRRRRPKVLGGNFSVDREALLAVNGFDEGYAGFSGEDSDLRNRLNNLGCRPRSLWDRAFVCHLDHALDPRRTAPGAQRAAQDRAFTRANRGLVRTPRGIAERGAG